MDNSLYRTEAAELTFAVEFILSIIFYRLVLDSSKNWILFGCRKLSYYKFFFNILFTFLNWHKNVLILIIKKMIMG